MDDRVPAWPSPVEPGLDEVGNLGHVAVVGGRNGPQRWWFGGIDAEAELGVGRTRLGHGVAHEPEVAALDALLRQRAGHAERKDLTVEVDRPDAVEGRVPHQVRDLGPQQRCARRPQVVRVADHGPEPFLLAAEVVHKHIHTCG